MGFRQTNRAKGPVGVAAATRNWGARPAQATATASGVGGSYGGSAQIPVISLLANGQIESASNATPAQATTYFGTGAPGTLYNNGDLYFDRTSVPYQGYVQDAGAWVKVL